MMEERDKYSKSPKLAGLLVHVLSSASVHSSALSLFIPLFMSFWIIGLEDRYSKWDFSTTVDVQCSLPHRHPTLIFHFHFDSSVLQMNKTLDKLCTHEMKKMFLSCCVV